MNDNIHTTGQYSCDFSSVKRPSPPVLPTQGGFLKRTGRQRLSSCGFVILSAAKDLSSGTTWILRCAQSLPREKRRDDTSLSVWLFFPRFHLQRCKCHACLPQLLLNRPVFGVRAGVHGLPALVEKQARHCLNVWRRSVVDHALSDWLR